MPTNQPIWKCTGRIGDVNPIEYGGGFIYEDETGVYPPELEYIESNEDDEKAPLTIYRLVLDRPRFKTFTEFGKRQWWISRYLDGYGVTGDYAKSANGRIRTFTSYESAKRVADKLNNESKGTL